MALVFEAALANLALEGAQFVVRPHVLFQIRPGLERLLAPPALKRLFVAVHESVSAQVGGVFEGAVALRAPVGLVVAVDLHVLAHQRAVAEALLARRTLYGEVLAVVAVVVRLENGGVFERPEADVAGQDRLFVGVEVFAHGGKIVERLVA